MTSDSTTGEIGKEETTGQTETKIFQRDWAAGVELSVDTDEDIKGFVKNRIEAYKQEEHQGDDLWWDFFDDFKDFTSVEDFKRAGTELPRKLRDVLRLRGVFLPKDKNSIAGNLLALLRLDEPPKWPSHDKDYKRVSLMINKDQDDIMGQVTLRAEMPTGSDIIGKREKSTKKDHRNSALDYTNKKPYTVNSSNYTKSSKHNQDEKLLANYNPHGYSRQLSTLTKLYDEQTKYSGKGDTFDYKFDIFLKQCANADIPVNALGIAFPTMLKEDARDFYYSYYSNEDELSLEELCKIIKDNFEGIEYKRSLLLEWNRLTFKSVSNAKENIGKSLSECLQILTHRLRIMQHGLSENLRNDDFIHNKIVTACEDQEAFRNVCERPSNTLNGLLSDLRSAAEHHDRKNPFANTDVALFTDRKYHQRRNIGRSQFEPNHGQYKSKLFGKEGYGNQKKCIVCSKNGCWSSNHPKSERDEAFERIKRNMTEKIHKNFSQYVLEIKGQPAESNITEDVEFPEKELDIEMESYILDTAFLSMKPTYETSNIYLYIR